MRALRGWPLAWFLLALAFAIRLLSLGSYPLMDTTEARYGEVARKMAELGDWITPWYDVGVPFWGKPPLAFWLSAGGQLLLGANEFASRLPHWLLGVLVLWLVWDWQAREDRRQARIACVLLGSSALFFVASGAVMTDMALALALVLAMRGFWLGLHGAEGIRRREGWLMFLGLGLGLLAKGPLTLILAGLPIGLWTLLEWRWRALWRGLPWIRGSLLMLLVAAPWYLLAELKTPGFLEYFLLGEHWQRFVTAGWDGDRYGNAHAYPYGSVWLFLLAAAFPWSLWLPLLLWLGWRQRGEVVDGVASRRRYWLFWGLAPCLFFTFAGNVLWTYVLPGLPALALLAADLLRAPLARSAWLRRGGLACLALTPLLFALFLGSLLLGSRAEQKSTAALLASDAGWRERPLVFWPKRPYSAVFYSGGRAQRAEDSEPGRLVASRRPAGDPLAFVRRLARRGAPALALPAAGGTVPAMPGRGAAWLRLPRPVGAVAGTRADARVVAAGVRAAGIDAAQAGLAVEVQAVAVGHAGEGEYLALVVEVLDHAILFQSLGDSLGRLLALELVDQSHADQVVDAHFHRQRAAGRVALAAQAFAVFHPGIQAVGVGGGERDFLHRRAGAGKTGAQ